MRHRLLWIAFTSALFALISGVAGWFFCDLLANPFFVVALAQGRAYTAACSAVAGAIMGLLLSPSSTPAAEGQSPNPSPLKITVVVLVAGTVAGAFPRSLSSVQFLGRGALYGFVCAIPMVAVMALVVASLGRLNRARPGSLVARADIRTLVAIVTAILGCFTALTVLDWIAVTHEDIPRWGGISGKLFRIITHDGQPPYGSVVLLCCTALLVAGLLITDVLTLRKLTRIFMSVSASNHEGHDAAALPAGRMDLGVGDEIAAPPALHTAYRGNSQTSTWIAGDFEQAIAILRQSVRRGVIMLAILEVIGLAHAITRVEATGLAADHVASLCSDQSPEECRAAALLMEHAGRPLKDALVFHQAACDFGQEDSCLATALIHRREPTAVARF